MTDQELIKALREDAEWVHANEWETPITLGDNLEAAADRLEALLAENEHLREATKMIPQWVSVSERLPELVKLDDPEGVAKAMAAQWGSLNPTGQKG